MTYRSMLLVWAGIELAFFCLGESNRIRKVTEYGQCPNTDTLGISETINPTKKF